MLELRITKTYVFLAAISAQALTQWNFTWISLTWVNGDGTVAVE